MKKQETQSGKKPDKKSPSNWSNLKKWILLQRFVKELEKVRKINDANQRKLQLETEPSSEKLSLRRQTGDEKKKTEEWMLDYALQQVVSQLAPTQRKKVALLVKAFETVVPPQEDSIQMTAKANKSIRQEDRKLNTDSPSFETADLVGRCAIEQPYALGTKSRDIEAEPEEAEEIQVKDEETAATGNLVSSSLEQEASTWKETVSGTMPEPEIVQVFPPPVNETALDKQSYLRLWHQHVVSSVAPKLVLDEDDDEETEDPNKSSDVMTSKAEFTRIQVLNLVKEAVQDILSPRIQDDSSDTLSVSSEILLPDMELPGKDHNKGAKESASNLERKTEEFDRRKEGSSPDEEKELTKDVITAESPTKVEPVDETINHPPKSRNWRKLKQLILLRRSIKAMEKARKLKFPPQQLLPQSSDLEPEKVYLKHQMMDERRKAEQWMLDYAVQNMVNQLTPARKTRVAMLVEAFEAVVPLPET